MRFATAIFLATILIGVGNAQQDRDTSKTEGERAQSDTDRSHPAGTQGAPPNVKPREIKPFGPPSANAKTAGPVAIPANAERIDSLHYRAKDEKGVVWNYTKTPFGVSKVRADETTKPIGSSEPNPILAYDQGETVRFEKITPFGKNVWTKNKGELTESERAALAASAKSETAKPKP